MRTFIAYVEDLPGVLNRVTSLFRRVAVDIRPLAQPDFRRLFVGQGVSFVGYQLTAVAVPVLMYAVTGSSFWVGLIGLAALVPLVVFGLYGGSIPAAVDRGRLCSASAAPVWAAIQGEGAERAATKEGEVRKGIGTVGQERSGRQVVEAPLRGCHQNDGERRGRQHRRSSSTDCDRVPRSDRIRAGDAGRG